LSSREATKIKDHKVSISCDPECLPECADKESYLIPM